VLSRLRLTLPYTVRKWLPADPDRKTARNLAIQISRCFEKIVAVSLHIQAARFMRQIKVLVASAAIASLRGWLDWR